ncbi:hypothetical protein HN827_08840 [archaeon]|jgi:UDP-N-acetylglucosamine--dolichyl-phosphate N-acetylglucosaminephosphotransferase|nr:hypothetical protein [archaeon]MBT4646743.1 hypothetical protein [archaeon]MBT6822379.1 hypothetical protein [archaeon]MBT7392908.1 hypothetical protein [archaeon]
MEDIQTIYKLILIFLYSFFSTSWALPYVNSRLIKFNYMVEDKYKKTKNKIPYMGGMAILGGILISLSLSQIFETLNPGDKGFISHGIGSLFIFYFIILIYALFGVLDDLFKPKKRYDKIIAILLLSFPIASLMTDTSIDIFSLNWELGGVYSLILAPIYIMVVANLVNLHSGYNGLAMGNAWLILLTILIKSYMQSGLENLIFVLPVFGALTAFLPWNIYPAKMLEGNVGSFLIGGAIGASLIALNMEIFGIFILIPHIINFIMDTLTIAILKKKDVKFGNLRKDGTIEAPPSMKFKSLKFLLVSWFRLTESQATNMLMFLTASFCILGLFLF